MAQIHKITILVVDHHDVGADDVKYELEMDFIGDSDGAFSTHVIDSVAVDPGEKPGTGMFDDEHIQAILERCRNHIVGVNEDAEPPVPADERCETCRSWSGKRHYWSFRFGHAGGYGFCRWKPYSLRKNSSEWCGQYKARKPT